MFRIQIPQDFFIGFDHKMIQNLGREKNPYVPFHVNKRAKSFCFIFYFLRKICVLNKIIKKQRSQFFVFVSFGVCFFVGCSLSF